MVPVINYWAVLVAAIAQFGLGSLWYGPLFGKPWAKLMGWSDAEMAAKMSDPNMKKKMMRSYAIMFVGAFIMAFTLDHAIIFGDAYLGMSGWCAGLQGAFWYWLGFVAPVTIGTVLWDGKPWKLWFINAGYYLVGLSIMAVILSLWV